MALASSRAANPHWTAAAGKDDLAHVPGDEGWPIIGNTFKMLRDPLAFGRQQVEQYGKIYRNRALGTRGVNLIGAEANELLFMDKGKIFSSEQGWGPVLNLLFPRGLMLMDFDHHRIDRRALGPAFKPASMRGYVGQMNDILAQQMPHWGGDMLFFPAIKQLTLDIAMDVFFGMELGPEADQMNKAYVDMVQASIGAVRRPLPFTKMGRGAKGREFVVEYLTPQIEERRRNENRQDMFSQFCRVKREDGSFMEDGEIVDHMNFLLLAAHDTTTSTLTAMAWMLASHPEWQDKLREECLAIAPAGSAIGYEDLGKFELMELAMKETLRLIPPVPSIPRRALADFEFMGIKIPKGATVSVAPAAVHLMEEYWPNATKFDPMRFTPEAVKTRHKYAWVPFGGGAHMCLGLHFAYMQVKLFMHSLLTMRRIDIADGYEPGWQAWPIPQPKDGLRVHLTKI